MQVLVQKCRFLETCREGFEVVYGCFKDSVVWPEGDFGACFGGVANALHLFGHFAAVKLHLEDTTVAFDGSDELFRKGVYYRHTYTVKTTGYFICCVIKFSAGVKDGKNNFEGWDLFLWVNFHRDTTAVVLYRYRVVGMNRNSNLGTKTCHRFVNRVINNFPDKVVKTSCRGGTYVHTRAFTNWIEAFKNFNFISTVGIGLL